MATTFGTSVRDTDVAGGVEHRYKGADDRKGATGMHGGYSGALRKSKNDDVLDHGEYDGRSFADRVATRKSGGWLPTKQNGDDLWDQVR